MILKIETLYYISVKLLITLVFLMFKIKYAMYRKLSEICMSGLNFKKIVLKRATRRALDRSGHAEALERVLSKSKERCDREYLSR